jgi:hypothetical protein
MTLTIGRATGLRPEKAVRFAGDGLDIRGTIIGANTAEMQARRQQILGLVDNDDELVVPVTFEADTNLDGYYRVRSARVEPLGVIDSATARFDVSLERVAGYRNPLIELIFTGVEIPGVASGFTTPLIWPQTWQQADTNQTPANSRTTETGVVWYGQNLAGPGSYAFNTPPANYYDASVRLEGLYGATWYPMTGTQGLSAAASLRLNNGLVRFTMTAGAQLVLEVFTGGAWRTLSTNFRLVQASNTLTVPSQVRIVRNGPEQATIRVQLSRPLTTASAYSTVLDVTLRRGFVHVDMVATLGQSTFSYEAVTNTASTQVSANTFLRQTSNDVNGNRWIIGSKRSGTLDLTNGRWSQTLSGAIEVAPLSLGVEIGGSGSVTPNTATTIGQEMGGFMAITQRVQAR